MFSGNRQLKYLEVKKDEQSPIPTFKAQWSGFLPKEQAEYECRRIPSQTLEGKSSHRR